MSMTSKYYHTVSFNNSGEHTEKVVDTRMLNKILSCSWITEVKMLGSNASDSYIKKIFDKKGRTL